MSDLMRSLPEAEVVVRQSGLVDSQREGRREELLVYVEGEPVGKLPATHVRWEVDYTERTPRLTLTMLAGFTETRSATGRPWSRRSETLSER